MFYGWARPSLALRRREDAGEELREHALPAPLGPIIPRRSPRETQGQLDQHRILVEGTLTS